MPTTHIQTKQDQRHARNETRSAAELRQRLLADLPVEERRLRLNGVSTAILEGGEGQPVVLLHGPGEHAAKCAIALASSGKASRRTTSIAHAPGGELHGTQRSLMEQFGFPPIPPSELERMAVPTALIWGRHDLATPLAIAHAASTRLGWPLHVIENAGDDPPLEQPDAFLETLRMVVNDRQDGGSIP
jgi:pimeloyl-ACP methyl ester carboxylesterase